MSLRQTFIDQFDRAFSVANPYFGDLTTTVTYKQKLPGDYNFATGEVDFTGDTTVSVKGLFGSFTKEQLTYFDVSPTDTKFVYGQKQYSFTPQTGDEIDHNGVTYQVIAKKEDVASSIWVLQLRETE